MVLQTNIIPYCTFNYFLLLIPNLGNTQIPHSCVLAHPANAIHANDKAGPPTPIRVMILLTFMMLKWPLLISQSAAKLAGKDAKYMHTCGNADKAPFCEQEVKLESH